MVPAYKWTHRPSLHGQRVSSYLSMSLHPSHDHANYNNGYSHDDSTMNIGVYIIITITSKHYYYCVQFYLTNLYF